MKLKGLSGFKSKVIKPCSKMGSKFLSIFVFRFHRPSFSSIKAPRFRISRRSRFMRRTRVVRFRKPFSIRSIHLPRCHPKTKIRFRLKKSSSSPPLSTKRSLKLRFRKKSKSRAPPTITTPTTTTPTSASIHVNSSLPATTSPLARGLIVGNNPGGERFGEKIAELLSVFRSARRSQDLLEGNMDPRRSVSDMGTVSTDSSSAEIVSNTNVINNDSNSSSGNENGKESEPLPSPITPAYVRKRSSESVKEVSIDRDEVKDDDEVEEEEEEDVCKSFENYLAEMIVDEGKLKDLMDVEELLTNWKSLKSPLFVDLVSRFYGEMCKDLFSPVDDDEEDETEEDEYEEEDERAKLL